MSDLTNFYDELRVTERTPVIELKSIYGLSKLRDITEGDVTSDGSEFIIKAQADGALNASLTTAERGPYPPGQEVEPGMAVRLPAVPIGNQVARFGYFDANNGWFLKFTKDGMYSGRRKNGIDEEVFWGSWEGDIVKGNFDDAFSTTENNLSEFRPADGYVYQFPFSWYGFGPTQFNFQMKQTFSGNWMKRLTTQRPVEEPSVKQPHLPLRAETETGTGDPEFEIRVSGRQVSVVGKYEPIYRTTSIERYGVSVSADWTPIMAVARESIEKYAVTKLSDIDVVADTDLVLAFVNNGSVPNTVNWEDPTEYDPNETQLQQNLNPGSPSTLDGVVLKKKPIIAGGNKNDPSGGSWDVSRLPMIETQPFIIYAKTLTGDTGTAYFNAMFKEDF